MGYYGLGREYEVEYRYDKREEYTGSDILGGGIGRTVRTAGSIRKGRTLSSRAAAKRPTAALSSEEESIRLRLMM